MEWRVVSDSSKHRRAAGSSGFHFIAECSDQYFIAPSQIFVLLMKYFVFQLLKDFDYN